MTTRTGARGGHFGRDNGPLRAIVASGDDVLAVSGGVLIAEDWRIEELSCGHVLTVATWSRPATRRRCWECRTEDE